MENIYPITDLELAGLSFCLGFLLINIFIYLYIYRKLHDKINLALLTINLGAAVYIVGQLFVVSFLSIDYNTNAVVKIYLLSEIALVFFGLSWIFYIKSTLILNEKFKSFFKILNYFSIVFITLLSILSLIFPDMLVTISTTSYTVAGNAQDISIIADLGLLHLARNIYLVIIGGVTAYFYLYEIFVNKRLGDKNILLSVIALLILYIFSIDELQASYTNKNIIAHGFEHSRFILGITIFTGIALYIAITNFIFRTFAIKKNRSNLILTFKNYEGTINNILKIIDNIDMSNKNTKTASSELFIISDDIFKRINALKSSLIKSIESNEILKTTSDTQLIETNINSGYIEKFEGTINSIEISMTERNQFIENNVSEIEECINTTYKLQDKARDLADISLQFKNNTLKTKQNINNSVSKMEVMSQVSSQIRRILIFMKNISDKTAILSINSSIQASKSGEWRDSFFVVSAEVEKLIKDISGITEKLEKLLYEIDGIFKEFHTQKDTIVANFSKLVEYTDVMEYDIKNIALDISMQNDSNSNSAKNIRTLIRINKALESIFSKDKSNSEAARDKIESLGHCFDEVLAKSLLREQGFNDILNDINKLFATSTELKNLNKEVTQDLDILEIINNSIKSKTFDYKS